MPHVSSLTAEQAPAPAAQSGTANVLRLAVAQALAGSNSVVVFSTGAIVGNMLAPSKVLATLPISIFVVGMAACSLPAGSIARRYGRNAAFMGGTGCGVLVGLLSALAILTTNFWLFSAAHVLRWRLRGCRLLLPLRCGGVRPSGAATAHAVHRDGGRGLRWGNRPATRHPHHEPVAPYLFAATFLGQAAVAALAAVVLAGVRLPRPAAEDLDGGRPLAAILAQPRFIIAVLCGAVSYLLMNFVMTAAPLAMHLCGHAREDANLGLQWHVIAMYGPSFFTGRLITRFGASSIVAAGLALTGAAAIVGLAGVDVTHFWLSLILLGVGWNFGFVGASALVLECHRPEERTRMQSVNDFIVFGMVALGSFSSGGLLTSYGWDTVLWVSFVPLALAASALTFTAVRRARRML